MSTTLNQLSTQLCSCWPSQYFLSAFTGYPMSEVTYQTFGGQTIVKMMCWDRLLSNCTRHFVKELFHLCKGTNCTLCIPSTNRDQVDKLIASLVSPVSHLYKGKWLRENTTGGCLSWVTTHSGSISLHQVRPYIRVIIEIQDTSHSSTIIWKCSQQQANTLPHVCEWQ